MRYDPCGRVVTLIRRPYRTTCRFFSDSDEENTIHWYVVPWSNGTLPYPHRIVPADWFPDKVNTKDHGEHSLEPRPFDGWGRIVPPVAPADHICGTAADFSAGCSVSDPRPPLVRGPDGIPTCCRAIAQGVILGGTGDVSIGRGALFVGGGTPIFEGSNDCMIAPVWRPLLDGSMIVMWGGGAGIPSVAVGGLVAGASYQVDITTLDTGNTVHAWGGVNCGFPAVEYYTSTGSLTHSFVMNVPGSGAPTQWIRNTAPFPAPSSLVISIVPL